MKYLFDYHLVKCNKCEILKVFSNFYLLKDRNNCKNCECERLGERFENNRRILESKKEFLKKYWQSKEKLSLKKKEYMREANRDEINCRYNHRIQNGPAFKLA